MAVLLCTEKTSCVGLFVSLKSQNWQYWQKPTCWLVAALLSWTNYPVLCSYQLVLPNTALDNHWLFHFAFPTCNWNIVSSNFTWPQPQILTSKIIGTHHICGWQITHILTIAGLKKNPVDKHHCFIFPLPPPETVYTDVTLLSNCCCHLSSGHTHGWRVAKEA